MTDLTVANTIRSQLGNMTLFMLGAKNLVGSERALSFRIVGSNKANHVRIALDVAHDLYDVTFGKVRGTKYVETARFDAVYVDSLHSIIESTTGLRTRI